MPRPSPPLAPALAIVLGLLTGCATLPPTAHPSLAPTVQGQAAPGQTAPGPAALPEMITDRPDFTESASVVPRGHVQVEGGYTYIRDEEDEALDAHSYPEALVRIGIVPERVELRIGQNFLTTRGESGGRPVRATGVEDLYLAAKVRLAGQRGGRPEMALLPQTRLPTGGSGFGAGRALPGLNFVYAWGVVPGFLSVSGSTQGNLGVDDEDDGYLRLTQSVSVGYELSDRVGAFTEWFADFPTGGASGITAGHALDAGFTVKIGPRLQWDVRAGAGLTSAADKFFAGSGLAIRY